MASERPLAASNITAQSATNAPHIVGAILVGGASRRFAGGDKAAVIGPLVLAAMRGALIDPIVSVGGANDVLAVPTVTDRYPDEGPLGAVATATTFARTGWVVAATCDLPLIEPATFTALLAAIDPESPETGVVASIDGQPQVSVGCWPAAWSRPIHQAMRTGERRFRHLLTVGPTIEVEVPAHQLEDADDEATLARLLATRVDMADPKPSGA